MILKEQRHLCLICRLFSEEDINMAMSKSFKIYHKVNPPNPYSVILAHRNKNNALLFESHSVASLCKANLFVACMFSWYEQPWVGLAHAMGPWPVCLSTTSTEVLFESVVGVEMNEEDISNAFLHRFILLFLCEILLQLC